MNKWLIKCTSKVRPQTNVIPLEQFVHCRLGHRYSGISGGGATGENWEHIVFKKHIDAFLSHICLLIKHYIAMYFVFIFNWDILYPAFLACLVQMHIQRDVSVEQTTLYKTIQIKLQHEIVLLYSVFSQIKHLTVISLAQTKTPYYKKHLGCNNLLNKEMVVSSTWNFRWV